MVNSASVKVMKDVAVQYDSESVEPDDSLDQQLVEAEARVMKLRQRKNGRALISRLPVEILIQIFSYHPASDRHPHVRHRAPPPWLTVTHVCQRWRNAAISCPFLWVDIISTNIRWAEEMLKRSRDVPIHITVDDGGNTQRPCEVGTAHLLFSKIYRAQSLVMTCVHEIFACMPVLFEAEGAPLLQELFLTNFHPSDSLDLVARSLFNGRTPNLQLLSLYRCRILWSSPLLQSDLIYLSISHILPDHRPHMQQVLEVLKRFTRLECLQLDEALPIHISSPNDSIITLLSVERLALTHLRFFSLCARSALDILDLTAHLLIPTSALFQLICEEFELYTPEIDSGDVMLAALASHLCAARDTTASGGIGDQDPWALVRSVHVRDIPAARSWSLFAGTGGPTGEDGRDASPPNPAEEQAHVLSLHLRWRSHPTGARAATSFIERAVRLPPLARARTLLVESDLFEQGSMWRAAFARAHHVEALFAGGGKTAAGAAQMLREAGQQEQLEAEERDAGVYAVIARLLPSSFAFERPAGKLPRSLFPRLRRLAIANADFGGPDSGLFDSLHTGLSARMVNEGGAIAQLAIWRCDVRQEQVDTLGELVEESKGNGWLVNATSQDEVDVGNGDDILLPGQDQIPPLLPEESSEPDESEVE
ncbi:hypothetical protein B0F90DRAFT_270533 [Multifurca ochricompacta]|uniref:F-box domain-containing protein n=1 Tax=Multifurca ochricompacta TaxID=376703 RepID=A0AAD4M4V8_9AGAM|nr:hypothetical protein B0F90DRAFT_270533 [Multifurca ochricompacta]